MVFFTYRLSHMVPESTHVILYLVCPFVCFWICMKVYDVLLKVCPVGLALLVGNRINK